MRDQITTFSLYSILISIGITIIKIFIGPKITDRLIALSVISSLILAMLVLLGIQDGKSLYLDVALVYDIFGFLGIFAISRIIKGKNNV
ncbi:MAG: MrpF/PhaF family protein [Chitinispirillaceae bacterium]|nr:MrpF/PhaF family protein [Chitinispirillaceae bacterium]